MRLVRVPKRSNVKKDEAEQMNKPDGRSGPEPARQQPQNRSFRAVVMLHSRFFPLIFKKILLFCRHQFIFHPLSHLIFTRISPTYTFSPSHLTHSFSLSSSSCHHSSLHYPIVFFSLHTLLAPDLTFNKVDERKMVVPKASL